MDICLGVRRRAKKIEGVTTNKIDVVHTIQNNRGGMRQKETWWTQPKAGCWEKDTEIHHGNRKHQGKHQHSSCALFTRVSPKIEIPQ